MAEEHRFQAPEGHKLCANNCGFFGNLTTSDLCSKCHRDLRMKEERNAIAKSALDVSADKSTPSPLTTYSVIIPALKLPEAASAGVDPQSVGQPNRCLKCRKRVGLTGFKCRCGLTFCGSHRYAEQHGCTYDYKKTGKEAIAKANPVVKASKLQRI